jgi:CheY-like chemotaxis protein
MVHLNIQTARDTPLIEADPSQIQQIIMNLVINGAEAIGEDNAGIVTVRTGMEVLELNDRIEDIGPGIYSVLEVVDTGIGMREEIQARIFEPFFTTKFTGRGLGLAAVLGIVRTARGAIRVRSAAGQGTTFRVLLPAKSSAAPPEKPSVEHSNSFATGTILVVDDEEIVRRTAKVALERRGFTVETAGGGKDALAQVQAGPNEFDLVLLDMNMPDLSGEETLRQLRAISPSLQVAVFSGYSEQEVADRLGDQPVLGILPKPFTARTLSEKVVSFLNNRPVNA